MTSPVFHYLKLAFAMCIVGSFIVVNKMLSLTFPLFLASGIRLLIGAVILNTLLWYKERTFPRLSKRDFLVVFVQSFVGVFLFNFFILNGLRFTSAVESGIITSTTPAVIALISFFFFQRAVEFQPAHRNRFCFYRYTRHKCVRCLSGFWLEPVAVGKSADLWSCDR